MSNHKITFFHRLTMLGLSKEREYILENISALLASGMPVLDALRTVREEVKSPHVQKIIETMSDDVQAGLSISKTFERSGIFSEHVVSLVRIGETTGRLVENLKIVAVEEEKERALRSKLRSATMYPGFVLSLTLVVGTGIAWFILPKLAVVFSQLKIKLPAITKFLIGTGAFLNEYGIIAVPVFFMLLGVAAYFIFFFPKTKIAGEIILLHIPGIKQLLKETELARFGYLLGTLLAAGLSPNEALDSLAKATGLARYRIFYRFLHDGILEGNSFKKNFALYKKTHQLLPAPVQQLIITGEQSGTLPETLIKIGQSYESKTETTAKDLTVLLEPILLVIVWLGVVGVALAVILPIYSLIGGLKTN